nr:reverse transcriptase domain-containing protein [Tanacetum cinerariifolium]
MSTHSSAKNIFSPLDNPELKIQRRSRVDLTLLNDFKMATEGNGDPSVLNLRTMEELYQPTLNGQGGPIAPIAIQVTNFGLKNDMIQQVQNSCQFHGLSGDDANKHLDKFLHVTQSIKVNGVTDDALCLYLFPHSLTHHATAWFDHLPSNSINTFEQMAKMFLGKYFLPSMPLLAKPRMYMLREPIKVVILTNLEESKKQSSSRKQPKKKPILPRSQSWSKPTSCSSSPGLSSPGLPSFGSSTPNSSTMNTASSLRSGTLPSNTITNPKKDLKGITTRSESAYQGPTIPTTFSSHPKVVERETEVTKYTVPPTNNGSTKDVQPPGVQVETPTPNSEHVVAPFIQPVVAP